MASPKETGLSEIALRFFKGKNFGHLSTIMSDGSPQSTPVWLDHEDGKYILINTAEGRIKPRNVVRDSRVAVSVIDQSDPYQMVAIRGRVIETITGQNADDHIDSLAKKYLGLDEYPYRKPGERRIILRIKPEHEARNP